MAVLTLENSSPMMVFSLEKSMMLKANLSPELGYRMPVMYNMIRLINNDRTTFVMTERRKRYSE